ncbi:MAG TPA: LptE family protein, partial [Chitinophagaceae bacterium]|nr:LptE family protein [Chitinophagaceae bacterium]HPH32553.1 LptE family protein [Chitinophagaceae bacterium]
MKKLSSLIPAGLLALVVAAALFNSSSCGIYRFSDAAIPDSIKTIKVNLLENRASYVNPSLSPNLSDKLRQKILSQTKLSQTNNDNADWEISGTITQYSFSTSAITGQQASNNRLTVSISIILQDRKADKTEKHEVSRSFEFRGDQS